MGGVVFFKGVKGGELVVVIMKNQQATKNTHNTKYPVLSINF